MFFTVWECFPWDFHNIPPTPKHIGSVKGRGIASRILDMTTPTPGHPNQRLHRGFCNSGILIKGSVTFHDRIPNKWRLFFCDLNSRYFLANIPKMVDFCRMVCFNIFFFSNITKVMWFLVERFMSFQIDHFLGIYCLKFQGTTVDGSEILHHPMIYRVYTYKLRCMISEPSEYHPLNQVPQVHSGII